MSDDEGADTLFVCERGGRQQPQARPSASGKNGCMRFLIRLLANAAALAVATFLLSGITLTSAALSGQIITLLVVAFIFGILNAIVKPIFALFSIPLLLLTLGLFLLVINACMMLLTSWLAGIFGLGWEVDGFWVALIGSIIVSVVSFLVNAFLPDPDTGRRD